jgi:hypothetical protein
MKVLWLICLFAVLCAQPIAADTITQINAQGEEVVLQRDAIVTHQDSSFVVYKHFDLKERRVTVVRLNRGSLPIQVRTSNGPSRAQIINVWKHFGFRASITDIGGKTMEVSDLYLDFYPPGGRGSLLESLPARTDFSILAGNAGPDVIDFDKIDHIEIEGEQLNIVTRDGKTVAGKFIMPTTQPAEVRVLGITDNYDPSSADVYDYSVPLSRLKLISFK